MPAATHIALHTRGTFLRWKGVERSCITSAALHHSNNTMTLSVLVFMPVLLHLLMREIRGAAGSVPSWIIAPHGPLLSKLLTILFVLLPPPSFTHTHLPLSLLKLQKNFKKNHTQRFQRCPFPHRAFPSASIASPDNVFGVASHSLAACHPSISARGTA